MKDSMPWARQVWHVFAKDLRRHKWMLLLFTVQAFVGLLGLTLHGASSSSTSYGATLLYFTLPITAAVLAAMVVLDDAPTLARAWWASLALSRVAVFGAKLVFIAVLIPLVMILAVAAMQWSFGVRGADLLLLSFRGARSIILTVLIAFPLAALLRDLRSFLLGAVVSAVAGMMLVGVLSSVTGAAIGLFESQPSWFTYRSIAVVTMLLLLMLTWRVYRTRSRTWPQWSVLLLLIALTLVGTATVPARSAWRPSKRLEAVRLPATLGRTGGGSSSQQAFMWSGQLKRLPPGLRGAVNLPVTRFEGPTACSKLVAFGDSYVPLQSPELPVPGTPVRWRGSEPHAAFPPDSVWTRVWTASSVVPAECRPVPQAELLVHQPRFLASVPLAQGQTFTRNGYRVSVRSIDRQDVSNARFANALLLATIEQVSSIPLHPTAGHPSRALSYVLLHPDRREGIQLHVDLPSGYGEVGSVSNAELHLILRDSAPMPSADSREPQPSIWQKFDFSDEADFDIWLRGAELAVFEWKLVGIIEAEIVSAAGYSRAAMRVTESPQ